MNAHPDFTVRRGRGLYENEVVNIFRLATVPEKEKEDVDIPRLLRQERDRFAEKIFQLKIDADHGAGGHTAGWNAAIDAALEAMRSG